MRCHAALGNPARAVERNLGTVLHTEYLTVRGKV